MKLVKMSLAAALLIGASAYAEVKTSGNAQLFYATTDANDADLFDKAGAFGNASASLDVETSMNGATVKGGVTFLTTLGLEHTLVSGIWAGNTLDDQIWVDELNFTFTPAEKTAVILGRQYLDTPLAFTETWNIVPNSFDAAVVANSDLPETTLVAAWVGRGNGAAAAVVDNTGDLNLGGNYNKYGTAIVNAYGLPAPLEGNGAYAFAAVTTLIPMTTAQVWYYDVESLATAMWLQADVDVEGITVGLQYASMTPSSLIEDTLGVSLDDSTAYAIKVGFAPSENLSFSAAYSDANEDGTLEVANTATGATGGAQSKLYTEAWWNYGYVGCAGTTAYNVTAEMGTEVADLGLYFTNTTNDNTDVDMQEITLTASKSFGALDASIAYIYTDADDQNAGDAYNDLQVYLTYNF